MALKQNIIYIYFKGKHLVTSKSQYQYNHGQFLYFADLDLPQAFEVHFSNNDKGYSKPKVGSNKLVEIPDEYYWSGAPMIYAWIYLHSDTDDGETMYEVKIPLIKRSKPTDEEPLPQQESAMERAIAELNNAVEITTENANKTGEDRTEVSNIRDEVVDLKEDIDTTSEAVAQNAQEAIDASRRSEISAQNAAEFEDGARNYSEEANEYAQSALESKNTAKQKADIATNASVEAMDYRDETKGYRDETLTARNEVEYFANSSSQNADKAESAVEHYPQIVDGTWRVWDVETGQWIDTGIDAESEDGVSPTVTITNNTAQGYHVVNITDKNGTKTATIYDGMSVSMLTSSFVIPTDVNGVLTDDVRITAKFKAYKGTNPLDVTLNGAFVTMIDPDNPSMMYICRWSQMTASANPQIYVTLTGGKKMQDGESGTFSINVTVDGKEITFNPTWAIAKQGEKGDTGDSGVYVGDEAPTDESVDVWIDTDGTADVVVTDVQVNGTSVVTDGVAEIPALLQRVKDDLSANGGVIEGDVANNRATGLYSHAEGYGTTANGSQSHAEGENTIAQGNSSHTSGTYTIARRRSQFVIGEYNVGDAEGSESTRGDYIFIAGNGSDVQQRSNAMTIDWNGNEKLSGGLTLGMGTNDETSLSASELKALKALLA